MHRTESPSKLDRKKVELQADYRFFIEDRLSDIVSSVFYNTLKEATFRRLRFLVYRLVGFDLLSRANMVSQSELLEQTVYQVLGPSARLLFERATSMIVMEFSYMVPSLNHYLYKDWGDHSRLISAIRGTADISFQYS